MTSPTGFAVYREQRTEYRVKNLKLFAFLVILSVAKDLMGVAEMFRFAQHDR